MAKLKSNLELEKHYTYFPVSGGTTQLHVTHPGGGKYGHE